MEQQVYLEEVLEQKNTTLDSLKEELEFLQKLKLPDDQDDSGCQFLEFDDPVMKFAESLIQGYELDVTQINQVLDENRDEFDKTELKENVLESFDAKYASFDKISSETYDFYENLLPNITSEPSIGLNPLGLNFDHTNVTRSQKFSEVFQPDTQKHQFKIDQKRHFLSSYGHRKKHCEHCNDSLFQMFNTVIFCQECKIVLHKKCAGQFSNESSNLRCEKSSQAMPDSRTGSLTRNILGNPSSFLGLGSLFRKKTSFPMIPAISGDGERRSTESELTGDIFIRKDEVQPYDMSPRRSETDDFGPKKHKNSVLFRIGSEGKYSSEEDSPRYQDKKTLRIPLENSFKAQNSLVASPENTIKNPLQSPIDLNLDMKPTYLSETIRLGGDTIRVVVQDHFINFSDIIFDNLQPIGEGGFGKVYKVQTTFNQVLALKVQKIENDEESESFGSQSTFLNEARVLFHLRNKFLQGFRGVTKTDNNYGILTEWCDDGTLSERLINDRKIDSVGKLNLTAKIVIAADIATGLEYLHSAKILHRDIKPENIFFKNGRVKIGDFGLAHLKRRSEDILSSVQVGTTIYLAPEILFIDKTKTPTADSIYTPASDVWSYGIMVYEIFARKLAFEKLRKSPMADYKVMWAVVKKKKVPEESDLPVCIREFYLSCVRFDKEKRACFMELVGAIGKILKENGNTKKVLGRSHSDLEDYWLNLKEFGVKSLPVTPFSCEKSENQTQIRKSSTIPKKPVLMKKLRKSEESNIRLLDCVAVDSDFW